MCSSVLRGLGVSEKMIDGCGGICHSGIGGAVIPILGGEHVLGESFSGEEIGKDFELFG